MQPKPCAATFLWLMQTMGLERKYRGSGTCFACDQPEFDPWHHTWTLEHRTRRDL